MSHLSTINRTYRVLFAAAWLLFALLLLVLAWPVAASGDRPGEVDVQEQTIAVSPDGQRVVYVTGEPNAILWGLWITPTAAHQYPAKLRGQVAAESEVTKIEWTPDSPYVVFPAMQLDGNSLFSAPAVSPGGNQVVSKADQNASALYTFYCVGADGGTAKSLTSGLPASAYRPV